MSTAPKLDLNSIIQDVVRRWGGNFKSMTLEASIDSAKNFAGQVAVSHSTSPEIFLTAATEQKLRHCVQSESNNFERELYAAALMVNEIDTFMKHPLAAVLEPQSKLAKREKELVIYQTKFKASEEKSGILLRASETLQNAGVKGNCIEDALKISDELITNAIFNAPFVSSLADGVHGISRHGGPVTMTDGKQGEFFVGMTEDTVAIACRDPFGSLDVNRMLVRVLSCYQQGVDRTMNMGQGGAGIGTYMVLEASTSFFVAVKPGQETLFVMVLPARMSQKKKQMLPKNFHIFYGTNKEKSNGPT